MIINTSLTKALPAVFRNSPIEFMVIRTSDKHKLALISWIF